jgi:hypothetical protein
MSRDAKKAGTRDAAGAARLQLAAIGMEAEFALVVDGASARPEDVFGDPRAFIRGSLMHRRGTSYHLPTGGAVYFDTGVLEIATPVIEIARGCGARASRSLWEGICFTRGELDAWERRHGRSTRLVGFSAHYNVSFERPRERARRDRGIERLAFLLAHVLPLPVMLFATNRRSTGVGVRPRADRIEVTADFTPNAPLMTATATVIAGIVRETMRWPAFSLDALARHHIPVIAGFAPMRHTSRRGWLARFDCFPHNPFACHPDDGIWDTTVGSHGATLRGLARTTVARFWRSIRALADPFTARLIRSVLSGRSPSLLDLDERPPEYEDVGRVCRWSELYPAPPLSRSRYERVLMRAISGARLRMHDRWYTPTGMRGWSQVIFRRDDDGSRHGFSIDYLLRHLNDWERPARTSHARSRE